MKKITSLYIIATGMEDFYSNQERSGTAFNKQQDAVPRMVLDDEVIWERFKKGNKAALTYIYRNYANPLYNYGCQIASDPELVKDAVQDLFIEIISHKKKLGSTTSIKYYLFKSLRNKLVKLLVKQAKRSGEKALDNDRTFLVSLSPELMLINRQMDQEKQRLITQKLNELPPLQREVLLLFYYEGMKYEQIAGILGMKVKSTRALVYRAIHSMSKLLTPLKDKMVYTEVENK